MTAMPGGTTLLSTIPCLWLDADTGRRSAIGQLVLGSGQSGDEVMLSDSEKAELGCSGWRRAGRVCLEMSVMLAVEAWSFC